MGERLTDPEAVFRLLANTAPVMVWMSGADTRCTFFNDQWLRFSERAMEEEIGEGWAERVHFEDFQRCMSTYVDAFVARRSFSMEYRLRRGDGEYRWVFDQGSPRYEPDGTFVGYVGSCVDVTNTWRARVVEDRLRTVLESVEEAILSLDEHGMITCLNPASTALFRESAERLKTLRISEILNLPWPTYEPVVRLTDLRVRRGDGSELIADVVVTRSIVGGPVRHTVVVRDVTGIRRSEQELIEQKDRIERRIGRDLHDGLGQLLTGVSFLAKEIEGAAPAELSTKASRLIALIERGIKTAHNLSRGLAPIHLESTTLEDALRELASQAAASHGIECTYHNEYSIDPPLATRTQLFLIAQEAIANSIRHGHATRIEIKLARADRGTALRVSDNGCGMSLPPATSGIGLRSMHQRARMIGGLLEIVPRTGGGVEIKCTWRGADHLGIEDASSPSR